MNYTITIKDDNNIVLYEEKIQADSISEALEHAAFYYTGDRFK